LRVFYDTEFIEDGRTIDLISIGMVAEDGREYYAVNGDVEWSRVIKHGWLMRNVVPCLPLHNRKTYDDWLNGDGKHAHLPVPSLQLLMLDVTDTRVKPRQVIANEVRDFILATAEPELWGWYAASDFVALYQLWGPLVGRPDGIPMWTNDLKQEHARLGSPRMPEQESGEHNALADARHVKVMAGFLDALPSP
jgi:hypothetical protein